MNLLTSLLFLFSLTHFAYAAEYFIAPDGNDEASGSKEDPLFSLQAAQEKVSPGDTVWVRGGKYVMSPDQIARIHYGRAHVTVLDKSGKKGQPIRYFAYKNEKPVFDFHKITPKGLRVHALQAKGSYLHLKGLDFTGVQVTIKRHTQSINVENLGSHNIFEQLSMYDGQGIGFWLGAGSYNLVLNCDAYRNHDYTSQDGRGGNTDGFGFHAPPGSVGNVFRGCRAWFNSDDGFDFIDTSEAAIIDNCWAFYNGYNSEFKPLADGHGFKAGGYAYAPAAKLPREIPRHTVRFCLAVRNKTAGFYANHQPGGIDWFNNSAYRNPVDYNMLGRKIDPPVDVPGYDHILKNNISFGSPRPIRNFNTDKSEASHNSFDLDLKISDKDFLSLDEAQLMQPRKPDGSLPDIDFMRLHPRSTLIDAGTPLTFPYHGKAPDLGCFEHVPSEEQ